MGAIKQYLVKGKLKERELHNSRLFVDLCENIHIHYREYRFVFSLDEFFEFANILEKSTKDIRNYLTQNPDYQEGRLRDLVIVAGGRDRQMKCLENSPHPHVTKYYNNDFAIELQENFVVDEIHIHYRDFRLVLDREKFKYIADVFSEAKNKLIAFEKNNNYERIRHPDKEIINENLNALKPENIKGMDQIDIGKIRSYWFEDIQKDWIPERDLLASIKKDIQRNSYIPPILVSRCGNDSYYIVDGHHRYLAHYELGFKKISCIVLPYGFKQTEKLRQCESLLKEIDKETKNQYNLSGFMQDYIAFKFNRYYARHFKRTFIKYIVKSMLSPNSVLFLRKVLLKIRKVFSAFGRKKQD